MASTLKDIAKAAGVSVTTVSLVLRDNQNPMISKKTREKVLEVARELKYRHNTHARALRMGKSRAIGLLMYDFESKIALSKLETIDAGIWEKGYRSLIRIAGGHSDMIEQLIHEYAGGAIEGLIIIQAATELTAGSLEVLTSSDVPIVTLEPIEGLPLDCATVDRKYGAYMGIKHLLNLGHRSIGMIHSHPTDLHLAPRLEGYRQALLEHGLPVSKSLLVETRVGYSGGYNAAKELLSRGLGVTAIFCNNDETAIGAMKGVQELGLRIPDDIAIIGFDNIDAGEYAPVPLTTIAQPIDKVAEKAVEMMFDRIENPSADQSPRIMRIKPQLIIRESCGGRRAAETLAS